MNNLVALIQYLKLLELGMTDWNWQMYLCKVDRLSWGEIPYMNPATGLVALDNKYIINDET